MSFAMIYCNNSLHEIFVKLCSSDFCVCSNNFIYPLILSPSPHILLFLKVQLQTILQSKYVEYFIEQVLTWQRKLNVADSIIFIWMEVQRTWSHLESIFIGSDDIRDQLPEDAKRFDGIDADFKVNDQ